MWERPQTIHETVRNALPGEVNTSFQFVLYLALLSLRIVFCY